MRKFYKVIPVFLAGFICINASGQQSENERMEATTPHVYNTDTFLIDPLATEATKELYAYMVSQYGKRIISGQTSGYYDNLVVTTSGIHPMLKSYDFQHYTQGYSYKWDNSIGGFSFGWDDSHETENAIAWYNSTNKKGIVNFQWHWHSPSGGTVGKNTFYTQYTSFSASMAVNTTTSQFTKIIQDIDSIASQLKKLSDANIPVLWRPLHEASGNGANNGSGAWFWWGAKGNTVCLKLYDIIYDRLANYHGLHNLIWVWSSPEASWYPGNTKVDIIGFDSYPNPFDYTEQKTRFDQLYTVVNGKKLVAMSENGPIPDIQKCFSSDAPWSYFMSWNELVGSQNSKQHIIDVFKNPRVATLENRDADISTLTGITSANNNESYALVVSPNPTYDKLVIADKILANSINKIEVLNLQGNKLIEKGAYKDNISLEGIPQGTYILNLYTPNQIIRQKVVKW